MSGALAPAGPGDLASATVRARHALADLERLDADHGDALALRALTDPEDGHGRPYARWCCGLLGLRPALAALLARAAAPDPPRPALLAEALERAATAPGLVRHYVAELERLGDGRVTIPAPNVVNPQAGAAQNRDGGPTGQPGAGRLTPAASAPGPRVVFEHVA